MKNISLILIEPYPHKIYIFIISKLWDEKYKKFMRIFQQALSKGTFSQEFQQKPTKENFNLVLLQELCSRNFQRGILTVSYS
jgi:hypothetical protein